jgi:polyisoprenoid-binding protein YceI
MTDTTTPTVPATRVVDGRTVPAAGTWTVDPSHSRVSFIARHMMVAKVRGSFSSYTVDLTIGEDPTESSLSVSIDASTIDTDDEGRDGHVRSADFLDVEKFPSITFTSTSVAPGKGSDEWVITGDLTIHGVTKPVDLKVELSGVAADPWGNDRAIYEAETEIDREAFGLSWNQPLAGGGVLVGKKIKIELDIESVRQAAEA